MKFCDCGKLFNMLDDIESRTLYHHCNDCDLKIPYESKLIYSKKTSKPTKSWKKYDKTLSLSEKKCFKCHANVIYEKRSDLTLLYICTKCNEEWC